MLDKYPGGYGKLLADRATMWPTPDASNHRDGAVMRKDNNIADGGRHGVSLHHAVMWPTPTSSERSGINPETGSGEGLSKTVKTRNNVKFRCSCGKVSKMEEDGYLETPCPKCGLISSGEVTFERTWPTPTMQDGENDGGASQYERNSLPLNAAVKLFPTPNAVCGNNNGRLDEWGGSKNPFRGTEEGRGSLNPDWVEWLMGLPIGWTEVDCEEPVPHPGWDEDPAEIFQTKAASERGPHTGREVVADRQVRAHKSGSKDGMTLETYVVHHPLGVENIPRLTTRRKHRVQRLKACGNGVVPQQAALALRMLL